MMAYSGKEIQSPDTRLIFKETDGELLRFEQFVQKDHAPIPAHVHPRQEERFVVISGRMGVRTRDKESMLEPGEEVTIPSGTPHTFWNASPGGEVLHHVVELSPALRSEAFFETVFGLQRDGRLAPGRPEAALLMAPVILAHENWIAGPPIFLQKALFTFLACLGRPFGYRTSYPHYSDDAMERSKA